MHRIDTRYAVDERFDEGNPLVGREATEVSADWLNDVQESLIALLTYVSITPIKGGHQQVLNAVRRIVRGEIARLQNDETDDEIDGTDPTPINPWGKRPIGSIEIRADNNDPAEYYGGVWQLLPGGYTLVNLDESDTTLDEIGKRRGSKTVKLKAAQNGPHSHQIGAFKGTGGDTPATVSGVVYHEPHAEAGAVSTPELQTASSGSGDAHENMQPSFVVRIWKRVS